jgi:hypothetical protein
MWFCDIFAMNISQSHYFIIPLYSFLTTFEYETVICGNMGNGIVCNGSGSAAYTGSVGCLQGDDEALDSIVSA